MKDSHGDLFDHFPMQAALGLYTLHKGMPDDEDDEDDWSASISRSQSGQKEVNPTCASKKTTSVTTKDTKP